MKTTQTQQTTFLITGGHATPAYAVVEALQKKGYNDFKWIGEKYNQRGTKNLSPEYKTVTTHYKFPFYHIRAGKLMRKWTRTTWITGILELLNLILGFIQAPIILIKTKPHIIISFGGFLAVPIVIWGRVFRKRIITHEQTVTTGLANKIIARFAHKILLSWKQTSPHVPNHKVHITGNPIRSAVQTIQIDLTKICNPNLPIIYITGGNQGAHEINKRIFPLIEKLLHATNIIHQTGNSSITHDYKTALKCKESLGKTPGSYIAKDYVNADEIGSCLQKADLIISRAGANTVTEILLLGKRAILIPIPWTSGDEQTKNAKMVEQTGLGLRLEQNNSLTSDDLYQAIMTGLEHVKNNTAFNKVPLTEAQQKARKQVTPDAAERIADIITDYLDQKPNE